MQHLEITVSTAAFSRAPGLLPYGEDCKVLLTALSLLWLSSLGVDARKRDQVGVPRFLDRFFLCKKTSIIKA